MKHMNKTDYLNLDGRLLQLLVCVHDEGSITRAAERLGVTQSAVSHMLDRLRAIVGDPLFVKSGRGIVATERAAALAVQARGLLDEMRHFVTARDFSPETLDTTITIAANDLQRDLLLPALLHRLRVRAPRLRLRVIPSAVPTVDMLRDAQCHLVISPRPPDGGDIVHKRLFDDSYRVFYDGSQRDAPDGLESYLAAEHVTVVYDNDRLLDFDQSLRALGIERRFAVMVPGFAGVAAFLRGSQFLVTAPGLLSAGQLRGLEHAPLPFAHPPMPMYLIWHARHRHDPAQAWIRGEIMALAEFHGQRGNAAELAPDVGQAPCTRSQENAEPPQDLLPPQRAGAA